MAKNKVVTEETKDELPEDVYAGCGDGSVFDETDDMMNVPILFPEEMEADTTVVKKVKVISDAELNEVKNKVVFRMGEGTNDKYSFSKVCNVSMQEKNTLIVILYLNEHEVDRAKETASFVECKKEEFLAPVNGILIDISLVEKYTIGCKYFKRGDHFGKIVVSLTE